MKTSTLLILVGVGAAGFVAFRGVKAAKELVTKKLNPASDQNFIYHDVIGSDENWSLGSQIYDWLHPNEAEKLGLVDPDEKLIKEASK